MVSLWSFFFFSFFTFVPAVARVLGVKFYGGFLPKIKESLLDSGANLASNRETRRRSSAQQAYAQRRKSEELTWTDYVQVRC